MGTTQNKTSPRSTLAMPVFVPSMLIIAALLVLCAIKPKVAEALFSQGQAWVTSRFSWLYVLSVAFFLVLLIALAISRYGDIRLGPDDARPDFSTTSWLAMLFAAGMGVGLMYFGVGEPMMHFVSPPTQAAGTLAAASEAMTTTFFHWGFHAWAIYAVVGLVLAYFGFRYKLPLTLRSGLYPIFRDRINGPIGHAVDVFALVGTIFGIATTLGYGVLQLSAGLHRLTGWETGSQSFQLGLIVVVVGMAGISAFSGLDKGVRRLSELNLILAILLMLFVLFAGPTLPVLGMLSENIGNYLSGIVSLTFRTFSYRPASSEGWFGGWTILYWAWWISWSPFVGLFIARISRGRTIREFIIGVLLMPTAFNLLWMTIFGNTALWLDMHEAAGALSATAGNADALLFNFFDLLPFSGLTSLFAVILITVFFVTSADSGAFVVDSIATRGNEKSPTWQRLFWAAVLGVTAAILLAAGGLKALQSMTLIAALPFTFIMLLLCLGLLRGLAADRLHYSRQLSPATSFWNGTLWKQRLDQLLRQPDRATVRAHIGRIIEPALVEVGGELKQRGVDCRIDRPDADSVALVVPTPDRRNFIYGVRIEGRPAPAFNPLAASVSDHHEDTLFEPTTFFEDGRAGYHVQYLTPQEVIADVLRQYERYLQLAQVDAAQLLHAAPGHTG